MHYELITYVECTFVNELHEMYPDDSIKSCDVTHSVFYKRWKFSDLSERWNF